MIEKKYMSQTRQRYLLHIAEVVVFVCDYGNFSRPQSGFWAADLSYVFQNFGQSILSTGYDLLS